MFEFHQRSFDRLAFSNGSLGLRPMSLSSSVVQPWLAPENGPDLSVKRAMDIGIALALLALLGIPMLVVGIMVRLTSEGPALFRQARVGLHGRHFTMLKFRTMYHTPASRPGCRQATRADPRVTPLGALLRRTSFDELPQLINVLAGSMSIVGPRPHAPGTCAAGRPFEHVSGRYAARHCVRPGMTGLAQVRGWRGETDTEEKLLRRLDSDLEYIAIRSVATDLIILCRTIVAVAGMLNAY